MSKFWNEVLWHIYDQSCGRPNSVCPKKVIYGILGSTFIRCVNPDCTGLKAKKSRDREESDRKALRRAGYE